MAHGEARSGGPAWEVCERAESPSVRELAAAFDLHPILAALLIERLGERDSPPDAAAVQAFLDPRLDAMDDPSRIAGVDEAVAALVPAIRAGERIAIFGDYDVDGISGTALLARILGACGAATDAIVPNRADGYGLTVAAVRNIKRAGAQWIVTVDNGIAAVDAAREAERLGLKLIVTDHHSFVADDLPPAVARVHPGLGEAPGDWRHASGAGVAFALAIALRRGLRAAGHFGAERPEPPLDEAMALATLGTIADVVPLIGANRRIVRHGLPRLATAALPGVQALLEASATAPEALDEEAVAFRLAPRLNAAGRMGDARRALRLLLSADPAEAARLAAELNRENTARQGQEQQILTAIEAQFRAQPDMLAAPLIFAAHPDWNHGVLGIVAGRLARRYHRPAILFQMLEDVAKASARGIPEVDLMQAIEPVRELALTLGGHREAAGMTLPLGALGEARKRIAAALRAQGGPEAWQPRLQLDARLPVRELGPWILAQLDRLRPFGAGNRAPLFASEGVVPVDARLFKGKHLGFQVRGADGPLRAIGFRMAEHYPLPMGPVQLAYRPQLDSYRGTDRVQLLLEDLRPAAI